MDHDERPNLTVNINLRLLAILGLLGASFVFISSYVRAQGDDSGSPNQIPAASGGSATQVETETAPEELRQGDQVYSANGEWIALDDLGSAPTGGDAGGFTASGSGKRGFYLTDTNYEADQTLAACSSGYHMASLWEILDVSNLAYASNHPQAYSKADSGSGPPAFWYGWARTGWNSSAENTAGVANCNNWSQKNTGYGTIVRLVNDWETTPGEIFTWDAAAWQCTSVSPVWCVEDRAP